MAEQKVFFQPNEIADPFYPNIYVFLVGLPGAGKSRAIRTAAKFLSTIEELHIAPTSMTSASMIDCMVEAKRMVMNLPHDAMEFNSMFAIPDEMSAFMSKYDEELVGTMTTFWDCVPYSQARRGRPEKPKIKSPQLSLLMGCTPANLIKTLPEFAWDQGFMARVIMVYSNEKIIGNMFDPPAVKQSEEMLHDLKCISSLIGKFGWEEAFSNAVNNWRHLGLPPVPKHPKLVHYNARRVSNLLKLSMVANIDRTDSLRLTVQDFNRAMGWLLEAEVFMTEVFESTPGGADSKALDEILHFINRFGAKGANEHQINRFAKERMSLHAVLKTIEVLEKTGSIKATGVDKITGMRSFIGTGNG